MQPTPVFLPGGIPWTEEPGGLQSVGSHRVRPDWVAKLREHREKRKVCSALGKAKHKRTSNVSKKKSKKLLSSSISSFSPMNLIFVILKSSFPTSPENFYSV